MRSSARVCVGVLGTVLLTMSTKEYDKRHPHRENRLEKCTKRDRLAHEAHALDSVCVPLIVGNLAQARRQGRQT